MRPKRVLVASFSIIASATTSLAPRAESSANYRSSPKSSSINKIQSNPRISGQNFPLIGTLSQGCLPAEFVSPILSAESLFPRLIQ